MTSRYAVPLAELEAVHVPVEEQTTAKAEPTPPEVLAPEEVARLALIRVAG